MPWHVAIDQASERRLGRLQIGTTRRGIGPAYADKAARIGIRVQDLLDPKILRQKIEVALAEKNVWLERVYERRAARARGGRRAATRATRSGCGRTSPTRRCSSTARCATGSFVLFEGAQATLLDLDHGTYPFVTSSNPVAGRARRHRHRADPDRRGHRRREGLRHARRRGPVPDGDRGARPGARARARRRVRHRHRARAALRLARPRRARYAVRVNGITSLALTKLDVLSAFDELPVCVAYRLPDGTETRDFPAHQSDFHHAAPVYETLAGWAEPLDGVGLGRDLPDAARAYVEFVERELGGRGLADRDRRRARARALAARARSGRATLLERHDELRDQSRRGRDDHAASPAALVCAPGAAGDDRPGVLDGQDPTSSSGEVRRVASAIACSTNGLAGTPSKTSSSSSVNCSSIGAKSPVGSPWLNSSTCGRGRIGRAPHPPSRNSIRA